MGLGCRDQVRGWVERVQGDGREPGVQGHGGAASFGGLGGFQVGYVGQE